MDLPTLLRTPGLVAGPAAALAFVAMVAAMLTSGDSLETSPLATASSALLLVALLGLASTAVAVLDRLREAGRGLAGPAIAVVGTVLVAGAVWATLFVLPSLAAAAPGVLDAGLPGVVVGFIASYVVFTTGWVWTGIALVRARLVPTWLGVLVAGAGVLAFVPAPEPVRLLVIGVATTLVARRLAAPAPALQPA